ncbi:TIGR00730 family Rossman fold protein [Pigmentibacter sp. JX0631]|uniref:LOG family protein n=1 Tax=Pigmentibacter sp. JX0631 TaxID=2976982 RepID=UPI002468CCC9|nr:TIGR00730 family Rossman fold protein [Pigmentibacter sp. JX0631]WGL60907.1 TIGR00730 family Rossman fold protein [Pigmentibacter sp. JX0631]
MKNICVFCGSNDGAKSIYTKTAVALGKYLASNNITLIYGGGNVGLMGSIANSVLQNGGKVIGVMPEYLVKKEIAHKNLSELHIVQSMHERKALMAKLADGFIALPGGFGTFEELLEIVTWAQLLYHQKPCAVLNVDGFYDYLIKFISHAVCEEFIKKENEKLLICESNIEKLFSLMINWKPVVVEKWIK